MSALSKIRNFLYRNRNKFLVGGVILTASFFIAKYAQQKLREWQEKETKEILERTRKQQHFESTERTCNKTILTLTGTLKECLSKTIDTASIIAELRTNPVNKVELWDKLKVLVFTKASSLIYLQVMIALTLRIQLNVIGGYLYKDSSSVDADVQQRYLSLCENLLNDGMHQVIAIIEEELHKIIGGTDLKKQLNLKDLDDTFYTIQCVIATSEYNPIGNLQSYIISDVPNSNGLYENMVQDLADLLDSDEVKTLANNCISNGFVVLSDLIADFYRPHGNIRELPPDVDFVHPQNIELPLAKLIPIVNGLLMNSLPDQFVQQLVVNPKVKLLGANIYECFCHT